MSDSSQKSKFDHLTVDCPIPGNQVFTNKGVENRYIHSMERMILKSPALMAFLKRVSNLHRACDDIIKEDEKNRQSLARLKSDSLDAGDFGSGYGYADDALELFVDLKYQKQLEEGRENIAAESGGLYAHLDRRMSELLSKHNGPVVNFGVGYAHIDAILARKFPNTHFIGTDRSEFTKVLNEKCFGDIKNLEFIAGDIFELLSKRRFDEGILLTARTLLLLPRSFIQKLYRAAAAAGFRYVVCVEQCGISRVTGKAYQFSEEDQPSQLFRSVMYLHNYPYFLKEAGFIVESSELVKTNHPHPDYRFLSFVAKR